MKTILITGSNGLTGQKLLLQAKLIPAIKVIAVAKSENKADLANNTSFVQLDLTDKMALQHLFAIHKPDIVIHTAALTLPDSCENDKENAYLQNVTVVENLLEVCKQHQSFFVHLSTDFVFDGEKGNYDENDLPNPISYYGYTKLEAERKILACANIDTYIHEHAHTHVIDYAIIRTCLVYGKNPYMSRSNIVLWVKNNLEQGKHIKVVNDQFRTPTFVDDLAAAIWTIALQKHRGIWHISGNEYVSPYQMALQVADFLKLDASLISPTHAKEFIEIAKRPLKTGFNIDKAQKIFGFKPHSFLEGLKKMEL